MGPKPVLIKDRFWGNVDKTGPNECWIWLGHKDSNGYGKACLSRIECEASNKRNKCAHRVAYELLVGPIAYGLTIDHLCKNHSCVNPLHMEVVTRAENTLRGDTASARNKTKTHCPHGHAYTPDNIYWHKHKNNTVSRDCKTCADARQAIYNNRIRKGRNNDRRTA